MGLAVIRENIFWLHSQTIQSVSQFGRLGWLVNGTWLSTELREGSGDRHSLRKSWVLIFMHRHSIPKGREINRKELFLVSRTFLTLCFYFLDGRTLIRSPDLRVFPDNGTLIINSVSRSRDEGFYTCRARNRQGQGAEGSTNLKVIGKESAHACAQWPIKNRLSAWMYQWNAVSIQVVRNIILMLFLQFHLKSFPLTFPLVFNAAIVFPSPVPCLRAISPLTFLGSLTATPSKIPPWNPSESTSSPRCSPSPPSATPTTAITLAWPWTRPARAPTANPSLSTVTARCWPSLFQIAFFVFSSTWNSPFPHLLSSRSERRLPYPVTLRTGPGWPSYHFPLAQGRFGFSQAFGLAPDHLCRRFLFSAHVC